MFHHYMLFSGYITMHFQSPNQIFSPSYVWTALKNAFPDKAVNEVMGMTLTADGYGAVFDMPAVYKTHVRFVPIGDCSQIHIFFSDSK